MRPSTGFNILVLLSYTGSIFSLPIDPATDLVETRGIDVVDRSDDDIMARSIVEGSDAKLSSRSPEELELHLHLASRDIPGEDLLQLDTRGAKQGGFSKIAKAAITPVKKLTNVFRRPGSGKPTSASAGKQSAASRSSGNKPKNAKGKSVSTKPKKKKSTTASSSGGGGVSRKTSSRSQGSKARKGSLSRKNSGGGGKPAKLKSKSKSKSKSKKGEAGKKGKGKSGTKDKKNKGKKKADGKRSRGSGGKNERSGRRNQKPKFSRVRNLNFNLDPATAVTAGIGIAQVVHGIIN